MDNNLVHIRRYFGALSFLDALARPTRRCNTHLLQLALRTLLYPESNTHLEKGSTNIR